MVGSVGIASLLMSLGRPNETDWRAQLDTKYHNKLIGTDLLIDIVDDVLKQRGIQ
ncbi:hypothetical protein ES705_46943 [subsurface metagenome]